MRRSEPRRRIVKAPDVRRAELLDVANELFHSQGFAPTTVDDIVRKAGVAKGTFYYYFRTKQDVLAALSTRLVESMAERSRIIAADAKLSPMDKFQAMFAEQRRMANASAGVVADLHQPDNRELHERNNVEAVRLLGPIYAQVVEEGRAAGLFHVEDALSTVQFVMAGSLFLFGEGVFGWSAKERAARMKAMRALITRALGMPVGTR